MLPGRHLDALGAEQGAGTYSQVQQGSKSRGITGAQAARQVLDANGLYDVAVEAIPGELSDHYDPRKRVSASLAGRLRRSVDRGDRIAAHEAGHAIQHAKAYGPLKVRTAIVPAVNIGSNFGFIVLFAGLLLQHRPGLGGRRIVRSEHTLRPGHAAGRVRRDPRGEGGVGPVGIVDGGVAGGEESRGVAKVLDSAAWTYIAGFAASVLTLLYYVMLVTGMRRSD